MVCAFTGAKVRDVHGFLRAGFSFAVFFSWDEGSWEICWGEVWDNHEGVFCDCESNENESLGKQASDKSDPKEESGEGVLMELKELKLETGPWSQLEPLRQHTVTITITLWH